MTAPSASLTPSRRPRRSLTRADYERYLPLVRRIAMRVARRVPSSIGVADLVTAGWSGVIEALDRPASSASELEAYVSHCVQRAMLDHLRGLDPRTRKLRNASRLVCRAISSLRAALERAPSEEEIAGQLGLTVDALRTLLGDIGNAGMARLELVDLDQPAPPEDTADDADRPDLGTAVTAAIDELPPALRQVLALRYEHECTAREIASILGVSEARAGQLHSEAMHRLRATIGRE